MTNANTTTTAKAKPTTAKAAPAVCNNTALATMLQGHIDQALERFSLGEQFSAIITGSKDGISANVSVAGTSVFSATLATADVNADAELLIAAFKAKVAPLLPILTGLAMMVKTQATEIIEKVSPQPAPAVKESDKEALLTGRKLPNEAQRDYLISAVGAGTSFEEAILQMPVATNQEYVDHIRGDQQV